MQIELRPHVGKNVATGLPVDLGQDRIFVDGQHVGYVGRKPDAPINLIFPQLPEDLKTAVQKAVTAKFGGQAARMAEPVQIPEELQDSSDEDLE